MDIDYAALTAVHDLDNMADEVTRELDPNGTIFSELIDRDILIDIGNRVRHYLRSVRHAIGSLNEPDERESKLPAPDIREALLGLGQLQALMARVASNIAIHEVRDALTSRAGDAFSRAKSWITTIADWIKNISVQLWNMLASLNTPKEWKLGGKLGTGPFNLAEASIEITFGRPPGRRSKAKPQDIFTDLEAGS